MSSFKFLAVVTGGGTGIGAAVAAALASRGAKVIISGRRLAPLRAIADAAVPLGAIVPVQADVSTAEGVDAITAAAAGAGLPVRYVVHNAAVLGPIKPLSTVSRDEWREAFAINVDGPLFLTQALLPLMSGSSDGSSAPRILHVGSGAAHSVIEGWGAYCTTKAALHMVYRVLAKELDKAGVLVGSVKPGVVDTPLQAAIRSGDAAAFPDRPYFVQLKETRDAAAAAAAAAGGAGAAHASAEAAVAGSAGVPPPAGSLDTPENAAAFIAWLLMDMGGEEYVAAEHDIRDKKLHHRWCKADAPA